MSNSYFGVAKGAKSVLFKGELGEWRGVKITITERSVSTPLLPDAALRAILVLTAVILTATMWEVHRDDRWWLVVPTLMALAMFWIAERGIQRRHVEEFAQALLGDDEPEVMSRESMHKQLFGGGSAAARKIWGDALFKELNRSSHLKTFLGIPKE